MSPFCVQHLAAGLPSGTYRPTTYSNSGTITSPGNAYDTDTTSYATIQSSGVSLVDLRSFTVYGFQEGLYSGTLTVRRAYNLESYFNGGYSSSCAVSIEYSLDGGSTWTTMLSDTSNGGENNVTVSAGDITASIPYIDLSLVRVKFTTLATPGYDEFGQPVTPAYAYIYAYDVSIS